MTAPPRSRTLNKQTTSQTAPLHRLHGECQRSALTSACMLLADRCVDTMVGTPVYACPKLMLAAVGRRQPVDLRKADAYSAGATLHEVLTGRLPTPLANDAGYQEYARYFDRRVSRCRV